MYSKEFWVTANKYHLGARYLLCLSMIRFVHDQIRKTLS
jgi:hypothetical protein